MAQSKLLLPFLPKEYGYVILTGLGAVAVNCFLSYRVVRARKQMNIEYPMMYSPDNNDFNCIQRAHQNTLENMPFFYFMLVGGGVCFPKASAAGGVVYLLSRFAFAYGYSSGNIKKCKYGSFGYLGMLVMMVSTLGTACRQLGCTCRC